MNSKTNAERLAHEGVRVLPIKRGEKAPLLDEWRSLMAPGATQSLDAYDWENASEDRLGIVTGFPPSPGSANLVAVDLDKVSGPQVRGDALRILGLPEDYAGAEPTPGGGFHIWVFVSGSVGTDRRKPPSGSVVSSVEVRGSGSQTIIYGEMLDRLSVGSLSLVRSGSLRELLDYFVPGTARAPGAYKEPRGDGADRLVAYLRGDVAPGSRHDETLAVSSILREAGVSEGFARKIMLHGAERLPAGYASREFERDFSSGYRYPRMSSGSLAPTGSMLRIWNPEELKAMEVQPTKFLLRNFLQDRGLVFLSGETGAGKSMLSLMLALDVSGRDREKFLNFPIDKRGAVIYVDIENPAEEVRRRIGVMGRDVPGDFVLVTPGEGTTPGIEEILPTIKRVRSERDVVAIVIDGVYLAGRGRDESSQRDVLEFLQPIQTLTRDYPFVLWVPLHRKKGNRDQRADVEDIHGSNVFGRVASQAFSLRRNRGPNAGPTEKVLRMTKVRSFSDEGIARAYLLETRPGTSPELYFVREIDEDSTLQQVPGITQGKKSDFDIEGLILEKFPAGATWSDLVKATKDFLGESTLRRILKDAEYRNEIEIHDRKYRVKATILRPR